MLFGKGALKKIDPYIQVYPQDKWMQHPTFPIKNLLKFNPYLLVQSI